MKMKVIISGGGTGGHIFPAIAIAQEILSRKKDTKILFVGANGKMEMEKVPAAGFTITGLDIAGFNRSSFLKNIGLPYKVLKSFFQAYKINASYKPDVVIGVGGYASWPTLYTANWIGIPTLIQEQNSFAGKSNIHLGKKARKICVAYEGMDKFFAKDKIILTGNPVRKDLVNMDAKKPEAISYFGLDANKKTILIMGGSLGSKTINETVDANLTLMKEQKDVQWIWQFGKQGIGVYDTPDYASPNIRSMPFIERADLAFAAADVILCRAGALTISELLIAQKPAILVPAPYVAEDHQRHNALSLEIKGAAMMIPDSESKSKAIQQIISLVRDDLKQSQMKSAQVALARPDAAKCIVDEIFKLIPQAA